MSTTKLAKTVLKIPMYIERGPTDILRALASTVKFTPNQPQPCYQDDPFLLPIRPFEAMRFTQYKLSGRKAARFFLDKYPELFYKDDSEPKIESFHPAEQFDPEMDLSEQDLKWCIENSDAINGKVVYEAIQAKGLKLDDEILLQFLELLCYTNQQESMDLIDIELSYHGSTMNAQDVWERNGLASKIFKQVKDDLDPSRTYSAMIAGLSKFKTHAEAEKLFNEFRELHPGKALYLEAYDALLRSVPLSRSSVETAHAAVDSIINHMAENLVKPDLKIFNSIFECYRHTNVTGETYRNCIRLLNDMNKLDIRYSLATFRGFMIILSRCPNIDDRGTSSLRIMDEILDYIIADDQILEIRDDRDLRFLETIMKLFAQRINNLKLAHKLHKIFLKNPKLFAYSGEKFRYLNHYFGLIITTDSLENIMNFYKNYIPLHFRPSFDTYEALGDALETYGADDKFVEKVGLDILDFGLFKYIKKDEIFRKHQSYVDGFETKKNQAKGQIYR